MLGCFGGVMFDVVLLRSFAVSNLVHVSLFSAIIRRLYFLHRGAKTVSRPSLLSVCLDVVVQKWYIVLRGSMAGLTRSKLAWRTIVVRVLLLLLSRYHDARAVSVSLFSSISICPCSSD